MNITVIGNISELTATEQKSLYAEGADIQNGLYYLLTDASLFNQSGRDIVPNVPALRSISTNNNISWILTNFRGKFVAFGSATI